MVKALIDQIEQGVHAVLDGRLDDIDIEALESAVTGLERYPVPSYQKLHDALSRNARVIEAARHGMTSARNAMQCALGEVSNIYDETGQRESIRRSQRGMKIMV